MGTAGNRRHFKGSMYQEDIGHVRVLISTGPNVACIFNFGLRLFDVSSLVVYLNRTVPSGVWPECNATLLRGSAK